MPKMTNVPPLGDWIDRAPWRTRATGFLLVHGPYVDEAHDLADKRELLGRNCDLLLVAWHGAYYTTTRRVTQEERAAVRQKIA